jgi:Bacteriophage tail sheath protein
MPTSRMPGVYIWEVSSGSKPIEGVGTSIAAFVGLAPGGPVNRPIRISSWTQFAKVYSDRLEAESGPFAPDAYLAYAVHGFFENGGRICWTVRTGRQRSGLEEALGSLAAIDDIAMVSVPDRMQRSRALESALVEHCKAAGNRMAILDPPPGLRPREVLDWRMKIPGRGSESAALYYPWLEVTDPLSSRPILVPPSGHVAGVWARTDGTHGVQRAPTDAAVLGVQGLGYAIRKDELGDLGRAGINSIRSFRGRGIRVWGSRTLSSDPEWQYVNIRRLFLYIEASLDAGTQWVVFEPNDEQLRKELRDSISRFLTRLWMDGALMGATPEEAFLVKCDEETNPPDAVESGQVVVEVGFAPLRPAEFVVLRISRLTAGASKADP